MSTEATPRVRSRPELVLVVVGLLIAITLSTFLADITVPRFGRIDVLLVWCISSGLTGYVAWRNRPGRASQSFHANLSAAAATLVAIAVGIVIPATYQHSTADRIAQGLHTAMSQQRFGNALNLADQLHELRPEAHETGQPIVRVCSSLRLAVRKLQRRLDQPLPNAASTAELGQRVSVLMQLDHNQKAFKLLEPMVNGDDPFVPALDTIGLCCQRLKRWSESLDYYQRAYQLSQSLPDSSFRTAAMVSAQKGIAYAARQLNQFEVAEAAYQDVLSYAPTAEHHFLLAKIYHDLQQTSDAKRHILQAMLLSEEYQEPGRELLEAVSMHHFGCLHARSE